MYVGLALYFSRSDGLSFAMSFAMSLIIIYFSKSMVSREAFMSMNIIPLSSPSNKLSASKS